MRTTHPMTIYDQTRLVGRNIKKAMIARRWNNVKLGGRVGVTRERIAGFVKGTSDIPLSLALSIASVLGVSFVDLFREDFGPEADTE